MKEKLNAFHIALLIYMIELDATVFTLPRVVAANAGTNGWLGVIGLSGLACLNIWLYRVVYRMGGGKSLFEILNASLPRWFTYPICCLLSVFWVGLGAFGGKYFVLIFQMLSFQSTNSMLIFLFYCIMIYGLLSKDLYSIMKANTLFFILTIIILGLGPYFFQEWRWIRLTTSFFQETAHGHTFKGWAQIYTVFVGYELCLFLFPYTDKNSKLFKGVLLGHFSITVVYLITLLASFGFYSFPELKVLEFPLIGALEFIELPFINRVENLVFPVFLYSTLMTTVMFGFAALSTLQFVMPKVPSKWLAAAIAIGTFLYGYMAEIIRRAEDLLSYFYFTEMGVAFMMPLLLILLLQWNKWTGKKAQK